ncbi:hypothetical protein ACVIGB_000664 [Bradyrhizobium sp. USDA 4341]
MELDRGNPRLLPHRKRETDLDATILIEPERLLVSYDAQCGKAFAFDGTGVHQVKDEPNDSFAGDDSTPKL